VVEIKYFDGKRGLFLDGLCMGAVGLSGEIASPYMIPIAHRIAGLQASSECLFLGGGAMILPAYASRKGHIASVWEVDPEVIVKSRSFVDDRDAFNITLRQEDAKHIDILEEEWFDFVLLDIWPHHKDIYDLEYFKKCESRLKIGGLFTMNYIPDSVDKKAQCAEMAETLKYVFTMVKYDILYYDNEEKLPAQAVYFCN